MSYTNETTHYAIPLPLGSDKTTPMDYNQSAQEVDTVLFEAKTDSASALQKANQLQQDLSTTNDNVTGVTGRVTTLEGTSVTQGQAIIQNTQDIADVRADALDMIVAKDEGTAQVATVAVAKGEYFRYNDVLYIATQAIAVGDTIVPNTNCKATNVGTELTQLNNNLSSTNTRIVALEKTNYEYLIDNPKATINANLVYASSQLATYIESKNWQTMCGGIEINASDGHIFGSYWCDRYGTMGGVISAIATTPIAYSYLVSNGVCTLTQLSN